MDKSNLPQIVFKSLTPEDLVPGLLDGFNRFQQVTQVWRMIDGERKLILEPFIDNWDHETKEAVIAEDFASCLSGGGVVICALAEGHMIAFASLLRGLLGSQQQYADLMQLHVSCDYRKHGLGKMLFSRCAEQAKSWGAQKLYISAHSAEETQAFYRAVGCVDAVEVNRHHVQLEPKDCQMEYVIA